MNARSEQTGAPVHKSGAIPAEEAPATDSAADPLVALDEATRSRLAAIAERLIPEAHGMPSAAAVLSDQQLYFVLTSRRDLLEPLQAALRPELGDDPALRLAALEREEPAHLAALQLVIVAGYYTDSGVRELIGYPGQLALDVDSAELPPYVEEGLIEAVLARGPVWRDPATGRRAVAEGHPAKPDPWPMAAGTPEGGNDGRQGT